jgi:hypothetical protein
VLVARSNPDCLGRDGGAAGVGLWLQRLQGGVSAAAVAQAFLASDEFYHRAVR